MAKSDDRRSLRCSFCGKPQNMVNRLIAGNGSYTFGDKSIQQANLPSQNGVLHLLNGATQFYPNLYEYLRMRDDIDMLRDYFMRYELSYLDTKNSVKGPVIGGIQTYIDSVIITNNSLTRRLNASLANEDSTYTFLMNIAKRNITV